MTEKKVDIKGEKKLEKQSTLTNLTHLIMQMKTKNFVG